MPDSFKVSEFGAHLTHLVLPVGLALDEVELIGEGGAVHLDPTSWELAKAARLTVRISESSIAAFLSSRDLGGLRDIVVQATEGSIKVEATAKVIVDIRVLAVCTLDSPDGKTLHVVLQSLSVPGPLARNMVESQLAKVNPVLDVRDLPLDLRLDEIQIADGTVTLKGTVTGPAASRLAQDSSVG